MPPKPFRALLLALALSACSDDALHLKLRLDRASGLAPGTPIMLGGQAVGKVVALTPDPKGGTVATLEIDPQFRAVATEGTRFAVARENSGAQQPRIDFKPGAGGGQPLAENTELRGESEPEPLFPFGEILKGFTEGLSQFRDQVERFRAEMQRLPQSEEAKRLKEEWTRLTEAMQRAQASTEEAAKQELPKLQKQLEDLQRRFKELDKAPPPPSKPGPI